MVEYAPYSIHGEGAWVMKGELGIVVRVTPISNEYQVVRVKWIHNEVEVDMACDVLCKVDSSRV